jgi:hypothetical protein
MFTLGSVQISAGLKTDDFIFILLKSQLFSKVAKKVCPCHYDKYSQVSDF